MGMVMWSAAVSFDDYSMMSGSSLEPFHDRAVSVSKVPRCLPGAVPSPDESDRVPAYRRDLGI
jgi:hypothetical protein